MKILYILSGTETNGGATKSFLAMADSVAREGHKIAVVVPDDKGVTTVLKNRGWEVMVVPYMFCTLPYLSWSPRDIIRFVPRLAWAKILNFKARKKVERFAINWHADLIHENTSVTDLGFYASKILGIPYVVHIREYGWQDFRRINPGLKRRLSNPKTFMVAITSELASFRGRGIPSDHVRVIYNGVISEQKAVYNAAKMPFFLYAGRIQKNKGVDDLTYAYIDYALAELAKHRKPLSMKFAGAFDSEGLIDELKAKISASGLDDYVEWLGEINDVERYYANAAATIISSKSEGFGRVMPEAMSVGSLCVVRKSGGLEEQLKNGKNETGNEIALCFSTVEELTERLTEIHDAYKNDSKFTNGGDYHRMISDSQKVVAKLYSYEANARNILDYYYFMCRSQNKND